MELMLIRRRLGSAQIAATLAVFALGAAGCGGDDDDDTTSAAADGAASLTAVKDYLTDHSANLAEQTTTMRELGEEYYGLAEAAGFDYERLLNENRAEVQRILEESKATFSVANPAYEEMEGIVAGVPRLAQYDVDIDAGADASDPENAVSFSLELPNGETLKQPGNLFFVTETALYGTNPDFLAKGVEGRRRRGRLGRVRRGTARREHLRRGGSRVRGARRSPSMRTRRRSSRRPPTRSLRSP